MDIKAELENVNVQIEKIATDYVDTRARAQVANLVGKIKDRQKMPNMVSHVKVAGNKEPVKITFLEFLNGINTEVPEKDKSALMKLEKRKVALSLLLESVEEEEAPEIGEKTEEPVKK